jgi:pSer/pThr/pTyr-binding forkhead associated (FHA) protein
MEPLMPVKSVAGAQQSPGTYGYLEVLNRAGRVVERIAVTGRDLRIGRAYDNDLILDDPYACSHHAQISWDDGELRVTDLQSVNGLGTGDRDQTQTFVLRCDARMHIGRTTLRFRRTDYQGPAALADHHAINPFQLLEKPLFQGAVFLLAIGLTLLESYFDSVTKVELLKFVPSVVALLVMILLWSTLWSFAGRLILQQWRFWTHCAIALSGFILLQSVEIGWGYFAFAFGVDSGESQFIYLMSTLFLGLLIFLHLHFVTAAPWQRLARTAAGIAVIVVGLALAVNLADRDDFSRKPRYEVTLKAPVFKVVGSRTSAEFFQEVEQMLVRVDADAAENDNH